MKRLSPLFALLLLALPLSAYSAPGAKPNVTVYRDRWGVPSIQADTLADASYGLGYAMAQDAAEQMARNYKLARGRMAEVDGMGALMQDTLLRALGIEDLARAEAAKPGGEMGDVVRAFCAGANRALAEQKGKLPEWIEPFTPTDVLSVAQLVNIVFPLLELRNQLLPGVGSNQFAVAGKRSASGHAILSADPHLEWNGPVIWYEFALYTKDIAFRGVTGIGMPFGGMGHTSHVAWSMTNNNPDLCDLYTIETNPNNPNQYSFHGEWRNFETRDVEMRFRLGTALRTTRQQVRWTAWGPVIPMTSQAVRFSALGAWEGGEEFSAMLRARDGRQFREALRGLGMSMWNIVYADTQGSVGYQYNARVPRRDESLDWTKPVKGSDPKTTWGPFWTIDELPHAINPASGLLANCNSSPWLTPLGPEIRGDGWPRSVTSYGPTTRYERLAALLSADPSISVAEAKQYATDTEVPYALKAIRELRRCAGADDNAARKDALAVLAAWNGRADVDARGSALYSCWLGSDRAMGGLARKAASGTAWSAAEGAAALAALEKAAGEMRRLHGRLDVPWGEVHTSRRGDHVVPVSGFGWPAAVVPNSGPASEGKVACNFGSAFRMIVHLDPEGVQSWSILPHGNSPDPKSPHYADQMALFGRGEYKETHFGLASIRAHAASTVVLRRE